VTGADQRFRKPYQRNPTAWDRLEPGALPQRTDRGCAAKAGASFIAPGQLNGVPYFPSAIPAGKTAVVKTVGWAFLKKSSS
jgi:hypothetical protein